MSSDRTEMRYPEPERNPRRVRAGKFRRQVAAPSLGAGAVRTEVVPIHIHTTRVMSHRLAVELRSRAHAYVDAEEAEAS